MKEIGADIRRLTARKELFEMLDTMRAAAWLSFDRRREYEWRICISLWVLLLLIGKALAVDVRPVSWEPKAMLFGLLLLMGVLHWFFTCKLSNAMCIDKIKAQEYEDRQKNMLGVDFSPEFFHRVWSLSDLVGCPLHQHAASLLQAGKWLDCQVLYRHLRTLAKWPRRPQSESARSQQEGSARECAACTQQEKCHRYYFLLPSIREQWSHLTQVAVTWILIALDLTILLYGIHKPL